MTLRNTAIAAAFSLVPIGQPLLVGTGAVLSFLLLWDCSGLFYQAIQSRHDL